MERVLVDTNIVLDLLSRRENFYESAQRLFSLADQGKVKLYVSSLTFANTYYILAKYASEKLARTALKKFKVLVSVLSLDDKIIGLSLSSDFKDFEDAIQYFTATENSLEMIITRNLKDFKAAKLPVMTAKDYLIRFQSRE